MADGRLNKCKACTQSDVREREERKREDPEWNESEKQRHREKYYRLGYKEKHKSTPEEKKKAMSAYNSTYPEKRKAKLAAQRIPVTTKGNNNHHWSYNEEHWRDVIELEPLEHYKLHRYIVYDQERMMFRRSDTMELLDTKERHYEYYLSLADKP